MTKQQDPSASGPARWLRQVLAPGGVMIDVGANVGDYSALAAEIVGPSGRVIAIEPAPANVSHLRDRFAAWPQVTVVAAAAGETPGSAVLHLDQVESTRHSLVDANVGRQGGTIEVRQVTLDAWAGELDAVDIVKIDAQGAELRILRGARRLLARFRPAVVAELWPFGLASFGATPSDVLAELDDAGYRVYRLSSDGRCKDAAHVRAFLESAPGRWRNINIVALAAERRR